MTASECFAGIWHSVRQIRLADNLGLWAKLQILFLKIVAIVGYHWGKFIALRSSGAPARPVVASNPHFQVWRWTRDEVFRCDASRTAVVVPVFAEREYQIKFVLRTVDLLLSLESGSPQHIILVDDAGPWPIPADWIPRSKVTVARLAHNGGPAAARNVGLRIAKEAGAALVCFLDDDCVPQPGWLAAMEAAQRASPGIVCGRTIAAEPNTIIGMYHDVCGTLNGRRLEDGSLLYGCTCNLSVDSAVADLDFDASFPAAAFEDVEFCVRARKRGISLVYTPAAVVAHHYTGGLWGLFRQFRRYGMYESQVCHRHPEYLNWLWSSKEISSYPDAPISSKTE